ncbi:AMP-dependent synthetase/ligase [Sedimenticola selenatireducens]|uniref:Long-chain fatty acid--CoA ligase n=1 Tax=Sedimenticola selenatireducens TaxID=191960 RepID=A0A558DZ16_9GAMM|nr:long-chain fatty acid--CoA ligase [Sedimenticola selenatireducens]TVO71444.1 long-chain fatty acid--CoA ligase [Sedimenticola selenatireducens]TVT66133.1 MAG: long-chain fatty acid--CoA ligase [Sedimenticola selenatireducens]
MKANQEIISLDEAVTLAGLFQARIRQSADRVAYRYFDPDRASWHDCSWAEMGRETARWQAAFEKEGLKRGDRVGIMMSNRREWVMFDQAALGLGLVSVPLFYNDRGGNVSYIAEAAGIKLLVILGREQWKSLEPVRDEITTIHRIVSIESLDGMAHDDRVRLLDAWLPETTENYKVVDGIDPHELCSIVYTSGTTGHPKGVMLSHHNILSNTHEALQTTTINDDDILLSFLPLSHMLERTGGYYLPMMAGITVAYARSILQLAEDLVIIRPTFMISVPRIYERIYAKIQEGLDAKPPIARKLFNLAVDVGWTRFEYLQGRGRWSLSMLLWPLLNKLVASKIVEKLGGRLKTAISGGAPLPPDVARTFLALGVPVLQGYGLTETSPVLAVSRIDDNIPESVGLALPSTQLKVADNGELLAKGAAIMLGFWNNQAETDRVIDQDGWFHTGDIARIDPDGHVYITGRIKDIIVLANGEKVSPADMEIAIAMDALFEQVLIIGEGRAFLSALIVPEAEHWKNFAEGLGLDPDDPSSYKAPQVLEHINHRISEQISEFPGYAQVRKAVLLSEAWSVENGYLTPTLKTKRKLIVEHNSQVIADIYSGH